MMNIHQTFTDLFLSHFFPAFIKTNVQMYYQSGLPFITKLQGVENVHTLCAGKQESDDRGNNISVKHLGTSLDRCIERYIKKQIIIIITGTCNKYSPIHTCKLGWSKNKNLKMGFGRSMK